jgi:hypothetical protein
VALLGPSRVPNLGRRTGLVCVDYGFAVRRVTMRTYVLVYLWSFAIILAVLLFVQLVHP